MKKRSSTYWWCQIGGWSAYSILYSTSYFTLKPPPPYFFHFLLPQVIVGVSVTHVMRLFFIKSGLLELNVSRQIILIFLTTAFFAAIYATIVMVVVHVLHWYNESDSQGFRNAARNAFPIFFINLSFWNMIYFFYFYLQRSRREEIVRINLENELIIKQLESERQVAELEMQVLRTQMNPHFIFNSLHSINKYILDNDKQHASEYLSKFAKLMRLILENSREQEIPLEKDLSALELYMQLEALRFQHRFKYNIEVDPEINKENTLIPPLLLQPFVENSIIHGIRNKEGGLITIRVNKEDGMIRCAIEDNGIGREQPAVIEPYKEQKHGSLGMKIIQERLQVIKEVNKAKASVNILDLKDAENKPSGLRIELLLPYEEAF